MFGMSAWELAFVLLLAFIVLGPKKLPEVAQAIVRFFRDFQAATHHIKSQIEEAVQEEPQVLSQSAPSLKQALVQPVLDAVDVHDVVHATNNLLATDEVLKKE